MTGASTWCIDARGASDRPGRSFECVPNPSGVPHASDAVFWKKTNEKPP
jgi:hypothetical protein